MMGSKASPPRRIGHIFVLRRRIGHIFTPRARYGSEGEVKDKG